MDGPTDLKRENQREADLFARARVGRRRRVADRIASDFCRRHAFPGEVVTTAIKRTRRPRERGAQARRPSRRYAYRYVRAILAIRSEDNRRGRCRNLPRRRQKEHDAVHVVVEGDIVVVLVVVVVVAVVVFVVVVGESSAQRRAAAYNSRARR